MSPLLSLLQHGVVFGLILSGLLMVIMLGSMLWNPAIWAGDYPPDIKARFGPPDARTQRQKRLITLPFLAVVIGVSAWAVAALPAGLAPTFANVFVLAFVIAFVFNLFDLLVIDWLIFVTWQPRLIILPGTEGLAGYRDYAFHFRAFLIGLGFCLVLGLLVAGMNSLIQFIA
jgi:hypothetical protein